MSRMSTTPTASSVSQMSAEEIAQLLPELESSGLSVAEFARQRDIPAHRLYWARRRVRARSQGRGTIAEFHEVSVVDDSMRNGSPVELKLPSGALIRVTRDFDEVALRRLIGVLLSC